MGKKILLSIVVSLIISIVLTLPMLTMASTETEVVIAIAWGPDGKELGVATTSGLYIYSDFADTGLPKLRFAFPIGQIEALDWSPDGTRLVTASNSDGLIRLWNTTNGIQLWSAETERDPSFSQANAVVAWSPDGRKIASGLFTEFASILVWEVTNDSLIRLPFSKGGTYFGFAWNPSSSKLAVAGYTAARIYDPMRGGAYQKIGRDGSNPYKVWRSAVAWHPQGEFLAITYADGSVDIVAVDDNRVQRSFDTHVGSTGAMQWSPDGTLIATAGVEGTVSVWDSVTGTEYFRLPQAHNHKILGDSISWSPHGGRLAYAGVAPTNASYSVQVANLPVTIVVPVATKERLLLLTSLCVTDATVRGQLGDSIAADDLTQFAQTLGRAEDTTISASCRADLRAVAEAMGN